MLSFGTIIKSQNEKRFTSTEFCGDHVIAGSLNGSIFFYTLSTDGSANLLRQVAPPMDNKRLNSSVNVLKVSPCLRYLAVGTESGSGVFTILFNRLLIILF